MPGFEADRTEITAFEIDGTYLFTHYFDQQACFEALSEYYDEDAYRFEVPPHALEDVRDTLDEFYIDLRIVEETTPYCVVVGPEENPHYADILRNSVLHVDRGEHTVFLMKDELSKKQAIEWGATPLDDADVVAGI